LPQISHMRPILPGQYQYLFLPRCRSPFALLACALTPSAHLPPFSTLVRSHSTLVRHCDSSVKLRIADLVRPSVSVRPFLQVIIIHLRDCRRTRYTSVIVTLRIRILRHRVPIH
jgi:hypothetical protein